MRYFPRPLVLTAALLGLSSPLLAQDGFSSPSGVVKITGGEYEMKSVSVGNETIPLNDYRAGLIEKVGNLVLVAIYSGGTACPATFAWLDTTPGKVRLTETFGTCSDYAEVSSDAETVTVTMPSFDASEGRIAFVYDGHNVTREMMGLESSETARVAPKDANAWIGESPYEYVTAPEHEAALIADLGWDQLDELRNTIVIGSQEMVLDGNWIVGTGCRPHMCDTDFAAIALHLSSGGFIAAIKRDRASPRLLGTPTEALPNEIRKVMTSR